MNCKGIHCPGCEDGNGPAGLIAVLVVLAVIAASARAIGRAVSEVVTILAITAASIAGAALAAGAVAAVVILRRRAGNAQLRAREVARAEALEWALEQLAARPGRLELPAARVPWASLDGHREHMEAEPRRSPR